MSLTNSFLAENFTMPLLAWFDVCGRKNLPWQHPRTPYRVWVSEIMLQQTQVKTVIPYFERFMQQFPEVQDLASASEETILAAWSGLGYYSRARNLLKTAQLICAQYSGRFPEDHELLASFPGIGPSTAAAITSQSFNQPTAILDGNVKRVLTRYFMVEGVPNQTKVQQKLWQLAEECMDNLRCADYTQAIMDLGATCCTRNKPNCVQCPLQKTCQAFLHDQVLAFPNKKLKKQLPTKRQQFILLHTMEDEIYLEKRASSGLWGGLWCCLMIDDDVCLKEHINKQYALQVNKVEPLVNFKHSFSHFHLEIVASTVQVQPWLNDDQDNHLLHRLHNPYDLYDPCSLNHQESPSNKAPLLKVAEPPLNNAFAVRVPSKETTLVKEMTSGVKETSSGQGLLEGSWFKVHDILKLGIPQPLRRIVESYIQKIS